MQDTFYEKPFPSHDEMNEFLFMLAETTKLPSMYWFGEYGANNHELLESMFNARLDETVVKQVGQKIFERGGHDAMVANLYIYNHFVGNRLKGLPECNDERIFDEMLWEKAKIIEKMWHGIGEWKW